VGAQQALAEIGMPRRQTTNQHQVAQQVDVAQHGLAAHGQRRRQLRLVLRQTDLKPSWRWLKLLTAYRARLNGAGDSMYPGLGEREGALATRQNY
jgi:hypothetical protein